MAVMEMVVVLISVVSVPSSVVVDSPRSGLIALGSVALTVVAFVVIVVLVSVEAVFEVVREGFVVALAPVGELTRG